jgi:ubiquinone/menaquinone biosynthesis C-methylase UbiE
MQPDPSSDAPPAAASPSDPTSVPTSVPTSDPWAAWLLRDRQGSDAGYEAHVRAKVARYVDKLLDGAALRPGMRLADIGCGEGGVAWRAIERVGPGLGVLMTDISAPLLRLAEATALERGVQAQCSFVQCGAEHLDGVPDASTDAVTTRAVLAYVADKPAALREFRRVLKPGGRLSIAEPVMRDEALVAQALRERLAATEGPDPFMTLLHRWRSAQFPDTPEAIARSPLVNYAERDLLAMVQGAGFQQIHLELHVEVVTSQVPSWEVFLGIAPHPWAPTLRAVLDASFTADERALFERIYRPAIEEHRWTETDRVVYVVADKPA